MMIILWVLTMYTVYMYHFIQLPSWTQVDTNMISILRKKDRIVRCMKRVTWKHTFSSVQLSRSVVSKSLRPHESQHARPPCSSPTPGVHSNSYSPSRWYHPTISSSAIPFSSFLQSLPASESFPMSQLFAWGGQSIRVSALASVLPMNTQDWFPLE